MSEIDRKIILNKAEISYLKNSLFLPILLKSFIDRHINSIEEVSNIKISESMSEDFRSAFTEQLAQAGFDLNYKLSPEGIILEALIDKFA